MFGNACKERLSSWAVSGIFVLCASVPAIGPVSAAPPATAPIPPRAGARDSDSNRPEIKLEQPAAPPSRADASSSLLPIAPSMLDPLHRPIDLNTALRLANVQNPDLLIARQRVVESVALRQLAAAQFLPSLNLGGNYDTHTGVLQQSNGNILSVNRSAVYVGAGSNAIAAGTVNIPGLVLTGNAAVSIYGFLTSWQYQRQQEFASVAARNQAFLQTALAYSELLRAEGTRAVAMQVRDDARRVARLTRAYWQAGQGRKADADRAATELARREADFQAAEGRVLTSSAHLCEVLNIDPSIRLHPTDAWVVPQPIVPDPVPVAELIALGLLRRPELASQQAAIRGAMLTLEGSKVLPFSPTILIGFSAGGFGGGSNLVRPIFGGFGGRTDLDAYAYWTLQNLGVGNVALIKVSQSRLGVAQYEQVAILDRVRAEVAEAYARTHARYAQIGSTEEAVRTGTDGYREDVIRLENSVSLPIELLDSLRLLAQARYEYLNAIVDYNEAQFSLYVALGQPPADSLARPVPTAGVVAPGLPMPTPEHPEGGPAPRPAASTNPPVSTGVAVRASFEAPRQAGQ
jgi:outer membrane protein TolC